MKFLSRLLRMLLLLALSCLGSVAARADAQPEDRQLLVMLQLPKAHYRPDSSYAGSYGDGVGLQSRTRIAEALARQHGLALQTEWPMPLIGVDCFVMSLPAGDARTPAQMAKEVSADARVAWSQPMQTFHAQSAAQNEPLYPTQPVARQWHLADLHRLATGKGVRVAVIDSGVEANHPDLAGQLQLNQNFVDGQALSSESHGTAVAGVIAARADNGLGIAGVAPGARLLALRACWQASANETRCNTLSLAKALQAAIQERAQIINMSLSGPDDRLLGVLLDQALARGIAVVAAQGGSASEAFPGNHAGVLAAGPAPPLPLGVMLAPGREVPTTALGGGWTLVSGSSFSAAHLTGLLALMRELDGRPDLRAAMVLEASGRIDTCATLARFVKGARPACGLGGLGHTSE